MRGSMFVFRPQAQECEQVNIEGRPELHLIKEKLDGATLECVPYFDQIKLDRKVYAAVAFCDDEHKQKQLPFNQFATALWRDCPSYQAHYITDDYLAGPVVVLIGDDEFMQDI